MSYAGVTERRVKQHLKMKEMKIDVQVFGKYEKMMEKEGKKLILTTPIETTEARKKYTITYRTMNLQTEEEIKKDIRKNVVFYTRGRFAVLEIRFADNDLSAPSVAITLRTEK